VTPIRELFQHYNCFGTAGNVSSGNVQIYKY
jgi:hypothetical protein